jgi:hypothetical protein
MKSKKILLLLAVAALMVLVGVPALAVGPTPTTSTISISPPSPVCDGDQVTITGKVTPVTVCGTIQIQDSTDQQNWTTIDSGSPDGSGNFSIVFDTTGLAGQTVYFLSHFVPGGGRPCGYGESKSPALPLSIGACCEGGLQISADLASGDGIPPPGTTNATWQFEIKVKACQDVTGVYAQGGTSGWTTFNGASQTAGTWEIYKTTTGKSSTKVLRWKIGDMTAGQEETLLVTVKGSIKPSAVCGSIQYLSGPWSATYSTDGGATFQKSDYTDRVFVTVTCAP